MKKILISILIILLLVLCYFALARGINGLNIKSINNIKSASSGLENHLNEANELSNKTYPSEVAELEDAIRQLKISKQEYENKKLYSTEESSLGTIQIKTYKIHYLWTILGNYRKDRGIQALTLDLKSTETEDVYDLEFTLVGSYTKITDYLYDIENDEELNFEIRDFKISSGLKNTTQEDLEDTTTNSQQEITNNQQESTSSQQAANDGVTLQATFTVENVGITLD